MDLSNPEGESQHPATLQATERVYCANCFHCKVLPYEAGDGRHYLRVRCSAGRWKKKLGDEKIYKYFTVTRRSVEACPDYVPMGEPVEFIRELRKTLPIKDEAYGFDLDDGIA